VRGIERGGQIFSAQELGGGKISVRRNQGGKISIHGDSRETPPPPPINNDRPLMPNVTAITQLCVCGGGGAGFIKSCP